MDKIRKYVQKFFKTTKRNIRYMISAGECEEIVSTIQNSDGWDAISAACKTFDYGYAKGYRAALAEMKKEGMTDAGENAL